MVSVREGLLVTAYDVEENLQWYSNYLSGTGLYGKGLVTNAVQYAVQFDK